MLKGKAMLTLAESEKIVKDCIRNATGFSGVIRSEHKLSEVGVIDNDTLDAVNEEIATNPERGVPSKHHEIDPAVLPSSNDKTVAETRDIVHDKAVELSNTTKMAFVRLQRLVRTAKRTSGKARG
jgi:hypothetical protein